ncbi:MAG: DUF4230 domain-containing protein [Chloroflexi bacterium]|nr:DUF4230 domain-containing protein [Chloroflexota bacterium]MBU1747302.1 DUF4230 domain-containing protein [Chloroflexota bacterium]MBU1877329.1 DUF4230 domain-containing protein [Chloroflexota bacterium]
MNEHPRRNAGCCGLVALLIVALIIVPLIVVAAFPALVLNNLPSNPFALPTPEPLPPPVVTIQAIRQQAKLITVEYRTLAEVRNERVPDDLRQYLGVKEEILLLVYGDVRAGFDLSKLQEGDLWTDGTRVQLHLPAPEILSVSIDEERTHVVYYAKSFIVAPDPNLPGASRQIAKDAIQQAAIEAGILEKAQEYGELFFENFLRSLGFTDVNVVTN